MYLCKYTDRNKKFASVDVIVYKKKCDKMASNKQKCKYFSGRMLFACNYMPVLFEKMSLT